MLNIHELEALVSSLPLQFDAILQERWTSAMKKGHFRYKLVPPKYRHIPGSQHLVALVRTSTCVEMFYSVSAQLKILS